MTAPTWQEALATSTNEEQRDALLQAVEDEGCLVHGWPDIAPQRALVEGNATALAHETTLRAQLAATASPTTCAAAGSSWVDAVMTAFDLPNGTGGKGRIQASRATLETNLLVSAAASPLVLTPASVMQFKADDGTIFELALLAPVTLLNSALAGTPVRIRARLPGTGGNVASGSIRRIITGPAGVSVNLGVAQTLLLAGREQETNEQYIARGLGRWGTRGAGWTRTSFDYLIPTSTPSITRWRVRTDNPFGPGTIMVILANASGPSTPTENASVLAALGSDPVMTLGTGGLRVVSAAAQTAVVTGSILGNGKNTALLANAKAALGILQGVFDIGGDEDGKLRLELIRAVLIGGEFDRYGIPGFGGAKNVTLTLPTTDITVAQTAAVVFDYSGLGLE